MTAAQHYQYLKLERKGRVLRVSFDSGDPVNSLNISLMRELTVLAQTLQEDAALSAVVLHGQAHTFSGGMNLADPAFAILREATVAEQRTLLKVGPKMCAAWEALDAITIAAIEGWCVGGGAALAAACDWRVAADNATFYIPELKLGMNMSWQSIPRLCSLLGPARCKRLLLLAEQLPAQQALDWGLVDYLAPAGKAVAKAVDLGEQVAAMPPVPVQMCKQAVNACAHALHHTASYADGDQFLLTQGMEDAAEGMRAFFEKRAPVFSGN